MAPIKPELMGDVWPAVQPGTSPCDHGSAVLAPLEPCEIRSFQTFSLTYTAGKFGLDDTGAIRIAFRFVHDGGDFQFDDPSAPNYVTAIASNGVDLILYNEPYAYRPWLIAVRVTVKGGYLNTGDTITLVFGDQSGGSPGMRMQTICEDAFEFKVSVDACATGQFSELEEKLFVPVVPGPPLTWHVLAPGLRRPGEEFDLGIRADDVWHNPAVSGGLTLRIQCDKKVGNLPSNIVFEKGARSHRVKGLSIQETGSVTFRLMDQDGNHLATSNPLVIQDEKLAGYWGDLHGQSGETVGINSITSYQHYARDLAFLDVSSHQANDFQVTNAFWAHINKVCDDFDEPGTFVCYPGYEWSGNTPVGGDHNVFYGESGQPIFRSSHAMLEERGDVDADATTLSDLFEKIRGRDCVLWAHVGGRPADVSYAHDPEFKTAVEVHSNWGTFEWILTDSLALGHRVGVVANSDGHKGRPGAGAPGATEFGAYGGLTCFLAPKLSRDAIFESMRRRHHFATTGNRLHLDVRAEFSGPSRLHERDPAHLADAGKPVTSAMMGDIISTALSACEVRIAVVAASPVERIDVFNGNACMETYRTYAEADLGNRFRIYWKGAQYRGRGRNVHWQGNVKIEDGKILRMVPVNHWNHERLLEQISDSEVRFETVTSGNFAGLDLTLDTKDNARLEVDTNLVSGRIELDSIGMDDHVMDAGGLERQILLRRLPDQLEVFDVDTTFKVNIESEKDNAIWVRVQTLDGHLAWSSPIYVFGN